MIAGRKCSQIVEGSSSGRRVTFDPFRVVFLGPLWRNNNFDLSNWRRNYWFCVPAGAAVQQRAARHGFGDGWRVAFEKWELCSIDSKFQAIPTHKNTSNQVYIYVWIIIFSRRST